MTVVSNVLKDAGSSLDNIVKCNVYLTNMADFAAMNEAYLEFFPDPSVLPVSSFSAQYFRFLAEDPL